MDPEKSETEQDKAERSLHEMLANDPLITDRLLEQMSQVVASVEIDNKFLQEQIAAKSEHSSAVIDLEEASIGDEQPEDIRLILSNAKLPQKLKLALLGNATCRNILIKDSNKMIQQCVLKNPKIQNSEIEEFAKNPNLSDIVLREIGNNSQWMRSYSLKSALVFNPKTPQAVSIKWVKFLNTADLRKLSKSKNVPSVIATAARKRLEEAEEK